MPTILFASSKNIILRLKNRNTFKRIAQIKITISTTPRSNRISSTISPNSRRRIITKRLIMNTVIITIRTNRNKPLPATVTIIIAQKVNIKTQMKLASHGTPTRSGCLRRNLSTPCQCKLTTLTTLWI
jgi:hypothetical protein